VNRQNESRSVVNIFNLSFLDILACTMGAMIFILVMVVLVNAYTSSQSELARKIKDLENKFAASQKEAAETAKRKAKIQSELKELENAQQLAKDTANLVNELSMKKKEVERLQQQIKQVHEQKIQIWAPKEYKTEKSPTVPLVFENQGISPMDKPFFKLVSKGGGEGVAERLKWGETLDIAMLPRSATLSMIRLYNTDKNYIPLVVYPSGFHEFRKFRDWLMSQNWDYSLALRPEGAPLEYGSGTPYILR
jgi:uncharacterized membrane-anchored protein YhcB (DUF1043 family)